MNLDGHGNVIPETVQIDRSTKQAWEKSLLQLYKQTVSHPENGGIRMQYEGELKSFSSSNPTPPPVIQRHIDQENGRGPAFNRKAREIELHNLRSHMLANRHDALLEAAYHEETQKFTEDFPEELSEHLTEQNYCEGGGIAQQDEVCG